MTGDRASAGIIKFPRSKQERRLTARLVCTRRAVLPSLPWVVCCLSFFLLYALPVVGPRRAEQSLRRARRQALPGLSRKKTDNPREGWEDGTPPPHRDFELVLQDETSFFSSHASNVRLPLGATATALQHHRSARVARLCKGARRLLISRCRTSDCGGRWITRSRSCSPTLSGVAGADSE